MTQDQRRALRTGVHTFGALVMLGYLGWIIWKAEAGQITLIGLGLVGILAFREIFHGVENSVARFKFSAGSDGISGEAER